MTYNELRQKRTPGPWTYQEGSDAYTHIVRGPREEFIVSAPQGTTGEDEANARTIVLAVNAHEALVDALKLCKLQLLQSPIDFQNMEYIQRALDQAASALKLAEGGK